MSELQNFSATEEMPAEEADPFPFERLAGREIVDEIASIVAEKASTGTRFYTRFLKSFSDEANKSQLLLSSYGLDDKNVSSQWYHNGKQPPRASSQDGSSSLLSVLPDNRLAGVEILRYGDTDIGDDQECIREEYLIIYEELEQDFRLRRYSYSGEDEVSFVDLSHEEARAMLDYIKAVCAS